MAEYYRTVFTIEDGDFSGLDLLSLVTYSIQDWFSVETGWPVKGDSGTLGEDEQKLEFGEARNAAIGRSWVVWERMVVVDSDAMWLLSVRLATWGSDLEADVEVRGVEDATSPTFRADPPTVVLKLLSEFQCSINGRRPSTVARRIPVEDSPTLLYELLDPARHLPTIVVSEEGDRGATLWTLTTCNKGSSDWQRCTRTITTWHGSSRRTCHAPSDAMTGPSGSTPQGARSLMSHSSTPTGYQPMSRSCRTSACSRS